MCLCFLLFTLLTWLMCLKRSFLDTDSSGAFLASCCFLPSFYCIPCWLWCLNFFLCLFLFWHFFILLIHHLLFHYSWTQSFLQFLAHFGFFHFHLLSLACSLFLLYLISPTCLLLCYRPVWLTGLRSTFSQRHQDWLGSNWRYWNIIFHCAGSCFTSCFHLTSILFNLSSCERLHFIFFW